MRARTLSRRSGRFVVGVVCLLIVVSALWPATSFEDESFEASDGHMFPKLVIVTPTSRPFYLSRSLFHVLPLRKCFDVHWVVVHTIEFNEISAAPFFRDVFHWIKELRAFAPDSLDGNHERNVAMKYIAEHVTGKGFVYFADDDNVLPDLCASVLSTSLSTNTLYYADQSHCGEPVRSTKGKDWSLDVHAQVACKMDTGSFLVPLALLRETSETIMWGVKQQKCNSDPSFFSSMIKRWISKHGASHVRRLDSVTFNFKHISEEGGCQRFPWTEDTLKESFTEFGFLLGNMSEAQKKISPGDRQKNPHIALNTYVHVLSAIRGALPIDRTVHFLEVGIWKGAASMLMSQHRLPTSATGVDTFAVKNQRNEAELIKRSLPGSAGVHWIQSTSLSAIPLVKELMKNDLHATQFDILLLAGDYNNNKTLFSADFEAYSALVGPGGFIVVDKFLETRSSPSVRESIWLLVQEDTINSTAYEIIGTIGNTVGASHWKKGFLDWHTSTSNEFILRKRG